MPADTAAPAVNTSAAAAADTSLSDDITAFLKEEPGAVSGESADTLEDTDASDSPALAQVADDDTSDTADTSTDTTTTDTTPKSSDGIDYTKLVAAVDAEDLPAFFEALGPAADKLLTSSAHKALRTAAKDLRKKQNEAVAAEQKAAGLAQKLADKYADPIEIRKAVSTQDPTAVDKFIDYAEKTVGADWNAIMKWVGANIAGRPARLQQREQAQAAEAETKSNEQKEALVQTQNWVKTELGKTDAEMLTEMPEVVDMVIDEIRKGYSRGIQNPAKALPLVIKKLETQHATLTKILARKGKGKAPKTSTPAPAARAGKNSNDRETRPRTLEEDIADIKREMGVR